MVLEVLAVKKLGLAVFVAADPGLAPGVVDDVGRGAPYEDERNHRARLLFLGAAMGEPRANFARTRMSLSRMTRYLEATSVAWMAALRERNGARKCSNLRIRVCGRSRRRS